MGVRAPLAARHVARCRRRQHPPSNNTSNGIWGRHGEQGPAAIALLPLSMLGQAALVAAGRLQVGCRSAVRRYGGGSSQAACGAAAPSASFRHAPLPRRVASDSCITTVSGPQGRVQRADSSTRSVRGTPRRSSTGAETRGLASSHQASVYAHPWPGACGHSCACGGRRQPGDNHGI